MKDSKDWKFYLERLIYRLEKEGIRDKRVLEALKNVPRHLFLPEYTPEEAYMDIPLPIGKGQTISQPFIVAYMLQELELDPSHKVLEIGTGSGYNAALLGYLTREVWTIERIPDLAYRARRILDQLGFKNVYVVIGDGSKGLKEQAPFDRIVITAASPILPVHLLEQLGKEGIILVPVRENGFEVLKKLIKKGERYRVIDLLPCSFVPLKGEYGY